MKTTLHQSISECLATDNISSVEKLFDRMYLAIEQLRKQGKPPVNYCYLVDQPPGHEPTDFLYNAN